MGETDSFKKCCNNKNENSKNRQLNPAKVRYVV